MPAAVQISLKVNHPSVGGGRHSIHGRTNSSLKKFVVVIVGDRRKRIEARERLHGVKLSLALVDATRAYLSRAQPW